VTVTYLIKIINNWDSEHILRFQKWLLYSLISAHECCVYMFPRVSCRCVCVQQILNNKPVFKTLSLKGLSPTQYLSVANSTNIRTFRVLSDHVYCLSHCQYIYIAYRTEGTLIGTKLSCILSVYLWLYSLLLHIGSFFIFLILYTVGRTPWTEDQPVARRLPTHRRTQTQNKLTQTSIPWVGYEPTILVFELTKTVHALDRAATVIGSFMHRYQHIINIQKAHQVSIQHGQ
jgi:hypothetical protein